VASDYRAGQVLFAERTFQENAQFFSRIFEIGRRYKIMNPEKMRSAYGKLMYMLQVATTSYMVIAIEQMLMVLKH
jgi:hypothetical protein